MSPATYFTYREEGRNFEDIGLWDTSAVSVTGTGEPERVQALFVTDGMLGVLRVEPVIGRGFTRDDDSPAHAGARDARARLLAAEVRRGSQRDRAPDRRGRDARARSSACCRRASGSSTSSRSSSCRSASIAPSIHAGSFSYQGDRPAEARRHDRAGQRRHRAHDPARRRSVPAAARLHQEDVRGSEDRAPTCVRWPRT